MKNKWLRMLLTVLVLWAGISLYFYAQHKYVVQEYDLNRAVTVGDTRVIFKQVSFTNYSNKTRPALEEYNIPWYFTAAGHLPASMQYPFIKFCNFYRSPYQINSDGTLKVKGIIISPAPYRDDESPLDKDISIDAYYGKDSFALTSRRLEWESNVCLFSMSDDHVPEAVDQVKAVITDKETGAVKNITIKPEWNMKIYHNTQWSEYPLSPLETAKQTGDLQ
ncbi:MAG TPA: hypothetical protein VN441_06270 [Syntrophomonas sp.]|nr:hypothetical protein [Syntrophomonas sp.]